IPVAMVGARRYRLSRTSWRGIRFSLRASTREFISIWVRGWLLTSLTLGLYYPFFVTSQQRFLTGHMWFGSQRFTFDGRGRDLDGALALESITQQAQQVSATGEGLAGFFDVDLGFT